MIKLEDIKCMQFVLDYDFKNVEILLQEYIE